MKRRNKKNVTAMQSIQDKTNAALHALYSTIDQLKEANDDISSEHFLNKTKIIELENQNGLLDVIKNRNEKIITNFETLLGINKEDAGTIEDTPVDDTEEDCDKCGDVE